MSSSRAFRHSSGLGKCSGALLFSLLFALPRSGWGAGQGSQGAPASLPAKGSRSAASVHQQTKAPPSGVTPSSGRVRDVHPQVRLAWLVLQTLPSPGVAIGDDRARLALSWQLTPLLYNFAVDRRLSRFRYFVVEPLFRQSGSLELFLAPGYLDRDGSAFDFGIRTGLRLYLPITERGDGLSLGLGSSVHWFEDRVGPSFDMGLFTLFGGLGLVVQTSPWFLEDRFDVALKLRYF